MYEEFSELHTNEKLKDHTDEKSIDHTCELQAKLEALLLVSSEGVSAAKLAQALGTDTATTQAALIALEDSYVTQKRGMRLVQAAGMWQLKTSPRYAELVRAYLGEGDVRPLSQAALETLAIVAYFQPVTRDMIRELRGVNSDSVIYGLKDKGLIVEAGYKAEGSQAALYVTGSEFLRHFGLSALDELPPLEDFAADERTRTLILERLSRFGLPVEDDAKKLSKAENESDLNTQA